MRASPQGDVLMYRWNWIFSFSLKPCLFSHLAKIDVCCSSSWLLETHMWNGGTCHTERRLAGCLYSFSQLLTHKKQNIWHNVAQCLLHIPIARPNLALLFKTRLWLSFFTLNVNYTLLSKHYTKCCCTHFSSKISKHQQIFKSLNIQGCCPFWIMQCWA